MEVFNGELLESVLYGRYSTGHETRNVFHYEVVSDGPTAVVYEDITDWMSLWFDMLKTHIGNKFAYYQLQLTNLTMWNSETFVFDQAYAGASVSELLPYQMAGLITFYTDRKKRLGKKYIPGFVEAAQVGSFLTAAASSALEVVANVFENAVPLTAGGELLPILYSRRDSAVSHVKSAVAREILATQRRRKPGIGI